MKHSADNAPVQWTLHPQKLATTVCAKRIAMSKAKAMRSNQTPNIGLNV